MPPEIFYKTEFYHLSLFGTEHENTALYTKYGLRKVH